MDKPANSRWPIAVLGLVVMLMGAWTIYQEVMPNVRGGLTAIERVAAMPDGGAPIGLTVLSQRHALLDCERVFRSEQSIEMQYLPVEMRGRLITNCAEMAEQTINNSPADSFAWLILAAARAAENDIPGFNAAFQRSQISGPNEGWLADMRLKVADANLSALSPETSNLSEQDLRVVASTYTPIVARRYVVDAKFRSRMTKVLETMDAKAQQRFISSVRAVLARAGR